MREDLQKLKAKLSFNRDILHQDPASKPWLRKTSVPIREPKGDVSAATAAQTAERKASAIDEGRCDLTKNLCIWSRG
jgi:hypothetical protein